MSQPTDQRARALLAEHLSPSSKVRQSLLRGDSLANETLAVNTAIAAIVAALSTGQR